MTYKLTPTQARGIEEAGKVCQQFGIPTYYSLLKALAGLTTAVRDDKPLPRDLRRAVDVLEQFRNESAPPPEVNKERLQEALARLR